MTAVVRLVPAALCLAAGFCIGWPWGPVVIAGCVALSLGGMWLLARFALGWRSGPPREPLRVLSVRAVPGTLPKGDVVLTPIDSAPSVTDTTSNRPDRTA